MAETWLDSIMEEEYQKQQGLLLINFDDTSLPMDLIETAQAFASGSRNIAGPPYSLVPLCIAKQVGDADNIESRVVDISKSQVTKRFVDLPDALRRVLVPTAKIYKTFVDEEGHQVDLRLKTDYWNNGLNRVELERIDFTRKGGNPAEVDTNIQFNIKLSARELGFFFKKQYPISEPIPNHIAVDISAEFVRDCEANGVAWIDLIKIDPGRSLQVDSESVINESDARIKVILGYADIGGADSDFKPPEMSDNEWSRWRNTIIAQQELFYLNIHQHQFDFKASGEVSLSVDFIAQGNGVMLTPNSDILLGPRLKEQYRIKKAQRKREQKRLREAQQNARRDGGEVYQACADDEVENAEGRVEGVENQLEYLVELGRRRILNQLELGIMHPDSIVAEDARVTRLKEAFNMDGTDGAEYRTWARVQVDDDGNTIPRDFGENSDGTPIIATPYIFLGDIIDAAMELLAANEWLGEALDDGSVRDSLYRRRVMNNQTSTFFLPWSNYERDDPRRVKTIEKYGGVILGDILFNKPDGTRHRGSLLKLPICYPLFISWWKGKTANMTVFYFKDFVSSLLTDFIPNHVFSSAVYDEDPVATERDPPEFSVFSINTPKEAVKELVLDSTWHSHVIESDAYEEKVAPFSTGVLGESINVQSSFMVIGQVKRDGATTSTKTPKIIWGQSTRGILERVQFKREDIPGYAVARLMADRQSTANNMMLREKYNTTIDMIGTTAFLPGGSVFLDPAPLDLGYSSTRNSFARQLGLGGLYTVLFVDHQMDFVRKSWTTSLDTKWESYGDGTTGDNPPSNDPCEVFFGEERLTLGEQVDLWASVSREARANAAAAQSRLNGDPGFLSQAEITNLNDLIATELERAHAAEASGLEYEAQIQEEVDRDARIEELGISEEEMSQLEYVAADGDLARAVTQSPLGMIVGGVFGAFDSVAESFNDEEAE